MQHQLQLKGYLRQSLRALGLVPLGGGGGGQDTDSFLVGVRPLTGTLEAVYFSLPSALFVRRCRSRTRR